ncbi:dihydroorotate dehydrogenase-like protein [Bacteroidota bacterium]
MANLSIKYLGLDLKNPIIVGASNLVTDLDTLKGLEDAGVAAIVYKSLFEEQIQLENIQMSEDLDEYKDRNAEMTSLFPNIEHAGPAEYLLNLRNAKESVKVPVFGSLNAVFDVSWVDYAKLIEETGVDGIELNFYATPKDFNKEDSDIINEQIEIIKEIKKNISIPVNVKLSPFYTNILKVVKMMDEAGANGFVLFNRLFQPDIDIEKEKHHFPYNLSNVEDNRLSLRFAGMLHGNIKATLCCGGGIFEGEDVIKMLLAGADSVQIVSTIYKNKTQHIIKIIKDIENWMNEKNYSSIEDFKGKLSKKNTKDPFTYKRAQYVDILMKSEEIFKKYPMI